MTHAFGTAVCCALFTLAAPVASDTLQAPVEQMATEHTAAQPIHGATATLVTVPEGAAMTLSTTKVPPGHVTTAWWVLITRPQACSDTPCPAEDVIGRAAEVGTQIVYADGAINDASGAATFTAFLPSGSVDHGWYDARFDDPTEAEIHLVLNDHGPMIPDLVQSMLTSYRGGCRDDSLPSAFPDTAKTDGHPGPNTCRLIQDAIFVQTPNHGG